MQETEAYVGEIELDPCPCCDGQEYVLVEAPMPNGGVRSVKVTCTLCGGEGKAYIDVGTQQVRIDP